MDEQKPPGLPPLASYTEGHLRAAIRAAMRLERGACAALCEAEAEQTPVDEEARMAYTLAHAIRARAGGTT